MKTIIGTKADVAKELTAQVAAVLASKPEANIAISAVDLPAEVLDALAASDIAFDRATLFQACEYCGAAGKGAHAVGTAFSPLTAAKPFAAVHAPDPDADAEHAADYDAAIQAAGGLDPAILGLGERGHVAFNEPGAGFGEENAHCQARGGDARGHRRGLRHARSRRRSTASRSASTQSWARKRSCSSALARAARRRPTPRSRAVRKRLSPRRSCSCIRMSRFILTRTLLRSYNQ